MCYMSNGTYYFCAKIDDGLTRTLQGYMEVSGQLIQVHVKSTTHKGWFTGVTVVKVGRIAAFGLGGGILLLHFATELGYLTVNWDRVRETSSNCQALVEKIVTFARNHSGYTVGFIGGFFFGVAST
ncbi:FUN14 domain-containing protein 2-like isoform X2 [Plodia interpunctella]|uniref:FUN14 domain-containing protein 2-like isoform X2 n=1 Tax=Plodia interpunctella TaxID=58824 RepID=UPI0023683197|nr:FUN14 domain-containing protein 2-like isoform X2 [Plodia interpunctella]